MRRILKAKITFISLCPKGKNRLRTLYKSDDNTVEFQGVTVPLAKFDELGELAAVVWLPNRLDSEDDWADGDTTVQMAHDFLRGGGEVDMLHRGKPISRDKAAVVESFMIQKGDPRFKDLKDDEGQPLDATGGWGQIIKVDDPELRRLYREGEWGGVSMFGTAEVRNEALALEKADSPALVQALRRLLGEQPASQQETDMDKSEVTALFDEKFKEAQPGFAKSVVDELQKRDDEKAALEKKAADEKAAADKLKADDLKKSGKVLPEALKGHEDDPEAIREFLDKRDAQAALEKVDWTDEKSVKEYVESLEESGEEDDAHVGPAASKRGGVSKKQPTAVDLQKSAENWADHIDRQRGFEVAQVA